ncbi:MAG: lipid-A-disaccharide synthase [Candidatus Aminicenantes bacterium]|nr:lipid-A-disaccharide synthase [Candidatus Aminicenantes bacterium]
MKNILLVAAENSAETYALQVVREFAADRGEFHFWGVGGERLQRAGVEIVVPNRSLSVVGIIEVAAHLLKIRRAMKLLFQQALQRRTAAALLIDYPDFNLRLARRLHRAGIPVYYYISPTVWAWRYSRVEQIRRWVTRLFIIFPFEKAIYQKEKITFTYTGHPLLDAVRVNESRQQFRRRMGVGADEVLLALLPGSRESEVRSLLPEMLAALRLLREEFKLKVFLQKAHDIADSSLAAARSDEQIRLLDQDQGFNLLNAADVVISTCGTSNLEAALLGVPFVAIYRVNRLTYLLGKRFLKIPLYSIVNILAGKRVVAELIQKDCRAPLIALEMRKILVDSAWRGNMTAAFAAIRESLRQQQKPAMIIQQQISADLADKESGTPRPRLS